MPFSVLYLIIVAQLLMLLSLHIHACPNNSILFFILPFLPSLCAFPRDYLLFLLILKVLEVGDGFVEVIATSGDAHLGTTSMIISRLFVVKFFHRYHISIQIAQLIISTLTALITVCAVCLPYHCT